jgi:hypothetical protein
MKRETWSEYYYIPEDESPKVPEGSAIVLVVASIPFWILLGIALLEVTK